MISVKLTSTKDDDMNELSTNSCVTARSGRKYSPHSDNGP